MRTILRTGLLLSVLLTFVLGAKAESRTLTCPSVEGQYTVMTVYVNGDEEYGTDDVYTIASGAKVKLELSVSDEAKEISEVAVGATLKAKRKSKDGTMETWEFTMPDENVVVTVKLKASEKKHKLILPTSTDYTITAATEEGNVVSETEVSLGKRVMLTVIVTNPTKKVASISVGSAGIQSAGKNKWVFSMPDEEVTVQVTLADKVYKTFTFVDKAGEYTVKTTVAGAQVNNPAQIEVGETVTMELTITKANHEVKTIGLKNSTAALKQTKPNTYTFLMPDVDVELEVTLVPIEPGSLVAWNDDAVNQFVTVTVFTAKKGELTNGKSKVEQGETVSITVTSNLGVTPQKEVDEIKINTTITAAKSTEPNTWTFTMPNEKANIVITLKEKKKEKYALTWDVKDAVVTVKVDGSAITSGTLVEEDKPLQIDVVPNSLKQVVETVKVDIFEARYEGGHYGTTMPNKASLLTVVLATRKKSDTKALTFADLADNYTIKAKVQDGELNQSPARVTIGDDVTLTVRLANAAVTAGKIVSQVTVGTAKVVRQNFETWTFEMPATDANVVVTMLDAPKHKFTFASVADEFSVEASTAEGKLATSPADVKAGQQVTLTIKPQGAAATAGKVVKTVTVGNETVTKGTAENTWTFTMPDENVALAVTVDFPTSQLTFADVAGQYALVVKAGNTRLSKSPATVNVGTKISVKVNVKATGKVVKEVTLQGATEKPTKETDGTWSFSMPAQDVTLQVTLVDEPAQTGITLTVNKAEGVEGGVVYTTNPATLNDLQKNSEVVFNVTTVPAGKKLVIVADDANKAVVTVNEKNVKYTVTLKEDDASVTLRLENDDAPVTYTIEVVATGAEVKITADGVASNGKNIAKDTKLVFSIKPDKRMTITSVVFDGSVLAPKSEGIYAAQMPAHNAKLEVKTMVKTPVYDALFTQIVVAPNPFTDVLRVMNVELQGATYEVVNAQGVVVLSGVLAQGETLLNTEALNAGLYLVRIVAANGETKTFCVVK